MSERPAYGVTVTREDQPWTAIVDGLPPRVVGATDVERFADLEVEVRDLVAGLTDTEPDGFELSWRGTLGAGRPGVHPEPPRAARVG